MQIITYCIIVNSRHLGQRMHMSAALADYYCKTTSKLRLQGNEAVMVGRRSMEIRGFPPAVVTLNGNTLNLSHSQPQYNRMNEAADVIGPLHSLKPTLTRARGSIKHLNICHYTSVSSPFCLYWLHKIALPLAG